MPLVAGAGTAVAVLFFIMNGAGAAASLFSDGFESGDLSAWTSADPQWITQGTTAHTGIKRGTAMGPGMGSLMKAQSTAGFENVQLSYWYRIQQTLESTDHVHVEWSGDGTTWHQLADHTGTATSSFQFASWALPVSAENLTTFEFRFHASLGNSSDVFWLDDVELTGDAIAAPTPTATPTQTPTPSMTPSPSPATLSARNHAFSQSIFDRIHELMRKIFPIQPE